MLVIRLQRTGRRGHAMFRVVVQDARRTPTSGKVVAWLGSYDPHAKKLSLDKEKATHFLTHGAQPSDRIAGLMQAEGIKLPKWVKLVNQKKRAVRHPEKRRSTRPDTPAETAAPEATAPTEDAQPDSEVKAAEPAEDSAADEAEQLERAEETANQSDEAATESAASADTNQTDAEA